MVCAVLALGAGSQLAQIVLLRELLTVFYGHELSIGLILAGWMLWVGIGSGFAPAVRRPMRAARWTAAGILILFPVTILGLRGLRAGFDVLPGMHLALLDLAWSGTLIVAPVCILLGIHFVFLASAWSRRHADDPLRGAANTYVVEAVGNAFGGMLFTLLLVHYLNAFHLAAVAGALMLAALPAGRRRMWRMAPLLVALSFPWLGRLDTWATHRQWRLAAPDQTLVDSRQSAYGPIAVLRRDDQYNIFQSGHLVTSFGADAAAVAFEEQSAANLAHVVMTQHTAPDRVLLVGGGLRGVLRDVLRHPVETVDYIEINPVLLAAGEAVASRATRDALRDPRVRVLTTDGRLHVKRTDTHYDLMLFDVPDPSTAVLNRYYTREFFAEAKSRLVPGGVLALRLSGGDLRGRVTANRNAAVYHTMRGVFPRVLALGEADTMLVAGLDTPGTITADIAELQRRFVERAIDTPAFSAHHFSLLLEPSRVRRMNWILRHHGRHPEAHRAPPETGPLIAPSLEDQEAADIGLPPVAERVFINSDFRPIGYVHHLALWNRTTRSRAPQWLDRLPDAHWNRGIPVLVAMVVIALGLRFLAPPRRRMRWSARYAVLTAVFTTGFSTMMLQVALLFAFQGVYGYVYERVGLIVALFMAGLAAGAFIVRMLMPAKTGLSLLAGVQLGVALVTVGIAFILPVTGRLDVPWLVFTFFAGITFFTGMLCGADFPLAIACLTAISKQPGRVTGRVYGLELIGACLGAVAASVVLAPVHGLNVTCLLAASMNFVAFIACLPAIIPGSAAGAGDAGIRRVSG